jgi:heavy metal efflux system protein
MNVAEAVFQGAEQRMRPMADDGAVGRVGLFPAAVSHGIGSQVQRPLAPSLSSPRANRRTHPIR